MFTSFQRITDQRKENLSNTIKKTKLFFCILTSKGKHNSKSIKCQDFLRTLCLTYLSCMPNLSILLGFHNKIKYQKHIKRLTKCNVYIYIKTK